MYLFCIYVAALSNCLDYLRQNQCDCKIDPLNWIRVYYCFRYRRKTEDTPSDYCDVPAVGALRGDFAVRCI
jgi:hypothetical protein